MLLSSLFKIEKFHAREKLMGKKAICAGHWKGAGDLTRSNPNH